MNVFRVTVCVQGSQEPGKWSPEFFIWKYAGWQFVLISFQVLALHMWPRWLDDHLLIVEMGRQIGKVGQTECVPFDLDMSILITLQITIFANTHTGTV